MKKALIVYGGWSGHEPEKCTEIIKGMLAKITLINPNVIGS